MAKFNLTNFRKTAGAGFDVPVGGTTERTIDQFWNPMADPHGRHKKTPGQLIPNRNQPGDQGAGVLGGGGSDQGGQAEDAQSTDEAWNKWFKGHETLDQRQNSDPEHSKSEMGDGGKESYPIEGNDQQGMSPLSWRAEIADPLASSLDNTDSDKRLPGGSIQQTKTLHKRMPVKAFNLSGRLSNIDPLRETWAHFKKGKV